MGFTDLTIKAPTINAAVQRNCLDHREAPMP